VSHLFLCRSWLLIMVALCNRADHYIFALWFLLSFFFFWSETWYARLAGNAGPKKWPKSRHLGTIAQLCRAISSQLRHVSTIGKNLLSIDMSTTYPHNMVNFGPLAAEICWRVWGTPENFNWFRVLAVLLHGI